MDRIRKAFKKNSDEPDWDPDAPPLGENHTRVLLIAFRSLTPVNQRAWLQTASPRQREGLMGAMRSLHAERVARVAEVSKYTGALVSQRRRLPPLTLEDFGERTPSGDMHRRAMEDMSNTIIDLMVRELEKQKRIPGVDPPSHPLRVLRLNIIQVLVPFRERALAFDDAQSGSHPHSYWVGSLPDKSPESEKLRRQLELQTNSDLLARMQTHDLAPEPEQELLESLELSHGHLYQTPPMIQHVVKIAIEDDPSYDTTPEEDNIRALHRQVETYRTYSLGAVNGPGTILDYEEATIWLRLKKAALEDTFHLRRHQAIQIAASKYTLSRRKLRELQLAYDQGMVHAYYNVANTAEVQFSRVDNPNTAFARPGAQFLTRATIETVNMWKEEYTHLYELDNAFLARIRHDTTAAEQKLNGSDPNPGSAVTLEKWEQAKIREKRNARNQPAAARRQGSHYQQQNQYQQGGYGRGY